ncbi:hypothetical protein D3C78_997010 [compost metagenome]
MDDQVAVQRQRNARGKAYRLLERGVAAGVPAGVEVGEAVQRPRVVGRIPKQVGDAEVHAAAPGEDFLANGALDRIGVALRIGFGEGDAHLHRATGVHRVQAAEQFLAEGHHADEVVEDGAQLLLGAHREQALFVGFAGGRVDLESGAHQQRRHVQATGAPLDFLPGDLRQPRHGRIGLVGGLLLGDRQYRAEVAVAGRDALGGEGGLDIRGPALAVRHLGWHQPDHLGPHFGRAQHRLLQSLCAAGGQGKQRGKKGGTCDEVAHGIAVFSQEGGRP